MPFPFQATLQSLVEPLRQVISRGLMAAGVYYAVPVEEDETFPAPYGRPLFSSVLIVAGLLVSPDVHVPEHMRPRPREPRTLLGGMWQDATTGVESRAWTLGHVVASFSIVHAMRPVLGNMPMYRFLGSGMNLLTYGVFRVSGHRRYLGHFTDQRGPNARPSARDLLHWAGHAISMQIVELAVLAMQFSNALMLQRRFEPGQDGTFDVAQSARLSTILQISLVSNEVRQVFYGVSVVVTECQGVSFCRWLPELISALIRGRSFGNAAYIPITLIESLTTDRWHLPDELAYLRGIPIVSDRHFRMLQALELGSGPIFSVPGQVVAGQVELGIPVNDRTARQLQPVVEAKSRPPSPGPVRLDMAPASGDLSIVVMHLAPSDFKRGPAMPPLPGSHARRPPSPHAGLAPFAPGSLSPGGPPSRL